MEKRLGIEGSGASRMVQLMRKNGYNKDVTIELATIATITPLTINVDGVTLEADDLILSATVSNYVLQVGDVLIVISDDNTQMYYAIDKAVI